MQSMKTLDWRGISGHRYSARAIIQIRRFRSQLVGECNRDLTSTARLHRFPCSCPQPLSISPAPTSVDSVAIKAKMRELSEGAARIPC
jgi:hypothetical protein